jgi:hypothetical protein
MLDVALREALAALVSLVLTDALDVAFIELAAGSTRPAIVVMLELAETLSALLRIDVPLDVIVAVAVGANCAAWVCLPCAAILADAAKSIPPARICVPAAEMELVDETLRSWTRFITAIKLTLDDAVSDRLAAWIWLCANVAVLLAVSGALATCPKLDAKTTEPCVLRFAAPACVCVTANVALELAESAVVPNSPTANVALELAVRLDAPSCKAPPSSASAADARGLNPSIKQT